jgi:hypothetical protein
MKWIKALAGWNGTVRIQASHEQPKRYFEHPAGGCGRVFFGTACWHCISNIHSPRERVGPSDPDSPLHFYSRYPDARADSRFADGASFSFVARAVSCFGALEHHRFHQVVRSVTVETIILQPNQNAPANRRPDDASER